MEMKATEDITIGEELIPPLPPLAFALHDSAVTSYCSACFSNLPPQPFPPFIPTFPLNSCNVPTDTPIPLYCSPDCSSVDSRLHFSSAEPHLLSLFTRSPPSTWNDSSNLRLSLRLVYIFQNQCGVLPGFPGMLGCDQRSFLGGKKGFPFQENENNVVPDDFLENKDKPMEDVERIAGLMTNREKLVFGENRNIQFPGSDDNGDDSGENTDYVMQRIRDGARMMAKARMRCEGEDVNVEKQEEFALEEMVLCLVLTNAVEVQDESGRCIGIAVYDNAFSWINHSCSPNACYRFLLGQDCDEQPALSIIPAATNGSIRGGDMKYPFSERNGHGSRVLV